MHEHRGEQFLAQQLISGTTFSPPTVLTEVPRVPGPKFSR
jgi:hypothetical protein